MNDQRERRPYAAASLTAIFGKEMPDAVRYAIALTALVSASAIAVLDWLAAPVPDLTILYVAPVAFATAFVGIRFGLFVAIGSAALRLAIQLGTGTSLGARLIAAAGLHLVAHVLIVLVIGYVEHQMVNVQQARAKAAHEAEELVRAQQQLKQKDREIRATYARVMQVVTGGKLILVTPEEFECEMGLPVSGPETLVNAHDVGRARHRIDELVATSHLEPRDKDALLLASSEALTNAMKHGRDASYQVRVKDSRIQVKVTDRGPGIDFERLPHATLSPGFTTVSQSLGMGFTVMLSVCDQVYLTTQPGLTSVGLEMSLSNVHGGR